MGKILEEYLSEHGAGNAKMVAYVANLEAVKEVEPCVARSIVEELKVQRSHLKLVASENYCSLNTQLSMGNLMTDKYAEGYPEHRYYGGCQNVDAIEKKAAANACALFGADHAYVQPHSGSDANLIAYYAILTRMVEVPFLNKCGVKNVGELSDKQFQELRVLLASQRLMGLDYSAGGHLTHGYRMNISSKIFESHPYTVGEDGLLDYDAIKKQAMKVKPLILLAGYSAYPRKVDFKKFREIADCCGATLMVDMAHFAGLVAGKVFTGDYDPVKWADVVTTTTHKTLRGPRGAIILCKEGFAEYVDKGCPMAAGGPLAHVMAAKAVALGEANTPAFASYAHAVVENAKALSARLIKLGCKVATGGTDNHLMLLDVTHFGLTGRQAEGALFECGITANANALPRDPNGPWWTSGVRLGTPGITTLGMSTSDMQEVAEVINLVLKGTTPGVTKDGKKARGKFNLSSDAKEEAIKRVRALLTAHPLYPELDLDFLLSHF